MKRRTFIQTGLAAGISTMILNDLFAGPDAPVRMPALFLGHGSPMNAIEKNAFSDSWAQLGKQLPRPKAILCVSAHWETEGTRITANPHPETIHDFGGFPQALFDVQYPAPGSPEMAQALSQSLHAEGVKTDLSWGLDHGAWSVLRPMFPAADIPVLQLSLDVRKKPEAHYQLAKQLRTLRQKGVLILGSGNIVHNLGLLNWNQPHAAYDWASEFNTRIKDAISSHNHDALQRFQQFGKAAQLSVPSMEHYLPLLYVMGVQDEAEKVQFFNDSPSMGSLYMTSVKVG